MSAARRWYIYLVCAISLQSVSWAIIALLRNLLISGAHKQAVAFQIAIMIIGLPVYLIHWLWGQRLVRDSLDERGAALRRFYLYGMMAGFIGPFLTNTFYMITEGDFTFHILAIVVMFVLWFYHQRVVTEDANITPEVDSSATIRRLYVYGFSAVGLTLTTMAVIHLFRWIMYQFGEAVIRGSLFGSGFINEIARLIIGIPLWIIFWRWGNRLFRGPSDEERDSALRKFYLYAAIFISAMTAVGNATGILAGFFRQLLNQPSLGDIRQPLPVILGMGILWVFHAITLQDDVKETELVPRQAGLQRLHLYLIAAIGLAALLVGLSGDISVLIRSLDTYFNPTLRDAFAWFTAAIIAGLPVWLIPWRQLQTTAMETGLAGENARRSVVRKIYLYFFLFVATMTVLSSAVYIIYRLLSLLLGADTLSLAELGQAISFTVIAAGVLIYHGQALRGDRKLTIRAETKSLIELGVTIVDMKGGRFADSVVEELSRELPEIPVKQVFLDVTEDAEKSRELDETTISQLEDAGLIVGPWVIATPGGGGIALSNQVAKAIIESQAQKLLIPYRTEGWEWVGIEPWKTEAIVRQTIRAIKQISAGDEVKPKRPMGAGAIIGIIVGVIFFLILLAIPLFNYFL